MRHSSIAALLVCLGTCGSCGGSHSADALTGTFSSTTLLTISAGAAAPADVYPSTIAVSGMRNNTAAVRVTLQGLTHTFPDDLDVLLVSPSGQASILMSDAGGATDVIGLNLTLDALLTPLPDATTFVLGAYVPQDFEPGDLFPAGPPGGPGPYTANLGLFNGANPNGTWSLFVRDDSGGDGGSISGWTLSIDAN